MAATALKTSEFMDEGAGRQAKLTAMLRNWTKRVTALSEERTTLTGKIYRAAYEWIGIAMVLKTAKSVDEGAQHLASTLSVNAKTVFGWYGLGHFMANNSLDAEKVNSGAVRKLYNQYNFLSKADQLRGLQSVKDGKDSREIVRLMDRSPLYATRTAARKAERLEGRGQLTKRRLRLEMRALKQLAQKYYGDDAVILIQIVKNGAPEEVV